MYRATGAVGETGSTIASHLREASRATRACLRFPGRGEASRRSDVDLLVVQHTEKRFLERYDCLLRDITQVVIGRDVDLLIYTPQELAQLAHRPLIVAALREGKAIYELQQEPLSGPTVAANC